MELKLYNTLTKKKEIFKPIKDKQVRLYTCGPTVYNYAHIGNLRTYIFEDILKRILVFNNFRVKHVMNITDVGHLTSDSDSGEDKIVLAAKKEHKSVWEIAKFYTEEFKSNLKDLNILPPDIYSKATDHIQDQINLIKKIEKNGYSYISNGNVYFDTSKVKDYGKLIGKKIKAKEEYSRTGIDSSKKNPEDFVLWFTKSKFEDQEMKWDSPWGTGYPGWHIECSAMSIKYLGDQFDIHCGGIDHIPIHHTNEIAQTESATGKKPWVKYWVHGEFLILDKQKMAKSGNNFITLATLKEKNYNPLSYRYFTLNTHYRKSLNFSFEALTSAQHSYKKLKDKIQELKNQGRIQNTNYKKEFLDSINDDLNTSKALAVLNHLLKDTKVNDATKLSLIREFDEIFGLDLLKKESENIPKEIIKLTNDREKARKEKNWKTADKLRDEINKKGWQVNDSDSGPTIKKK